jgi:poly(beta-D-mannuronate) lyase
MKQTLAIILALLLGSLAALPASDLQSAISAAGMKNSLRQDLQRPVDARLLKIEAQGIDGCGLFQGAAHVVRSAREIEALSDKLKPGDQLVLAADASWKDARFSFGGIGTEESPILIRPERPGSVVFSGATEVGFYGAHLIITGLEFKEVTIPASGTVVFRLGWGEAKPADHCIVHRITIENCNSPSPDDWPKKKAWYMTVSIGSDNTVAHSKFTGLRHLGQMIGAANLPPERLQRLHLLNNHFANRPYLDAQNGYEIIQIGWSGENARPTGSLIEGNTFENCDGENELITLKASDVIVRHNTFNACQGVLCLRAANRVLVEDNVFDGQGRPNTGGVRLQGADHVVIGNTFRDLRKPKDYYAWPISLMAASAENYGDHGDVAGYGRAKNILIARNRFEHCDAGIAAGIYARKEFPLLPANIQVRDNVFTGTRATSAFDFIAPDPSGALAGELHESGNQFQP